MSRSQPHTQSRPHRPRQSDRGRHHHSSNTSPRHAHETSQHDQSASRASYQSCVPVNGGYTYHVEVPVNGDYNDHDASPSSYENNSPYTHQDSNPTHHHPHSTQYTPVPRLWTHPNTQLDHAVHNTSLPSPSVPSSSSTSEPSNPQRSTRRRTSTYQSSSGPRTVSTPHHALAQDAYARQILLTSEHVRDLGQTSTMSRFERMKQHDAPWDAVGWVRSDGRFNEEYE